ncbi:imidazole glycerol phosphate synthase subunit HisH, partial [Helicobacter bilis]
MQIGVVDYGVGNIANVMRCLEYVARTETIKRVSTHKDIQACDKIILPGVGAFGSAMEHLSARDLDKSLCEYAKSGRYMLGICLGMQLLFEKSYEFGEYKGLGLVEGFVAPFGSKDSIEWHIKTNMGFNDIESKGLDSTKSYPTPNNHSIEIESRFYKVCTHPNGRES